MTKTALLVAYHFPPVQTSSGLQRTLAMTQYLAENGWSPAVLTTNPRAYEKTSPSQLTDIPKDVPLERAFALDTGRHLAIRGHYPKILALPDRWVSWWFGGLVSGLRLIRKYKPTVIWTTYPIATAHLIGLTLHRLTGLPWVADFRDSMTEEDYPRERFRKSVFQWIERKTVKYCSRAIFTTPGAVKMYRERYPELPADRWQLIPNGYNEKIFSEVERELSSVGQTSTKSGTITIVHSGVIYPSERDPVPLFDAVARLKREGVIVAGQFKLVLRATGHDPIYQPMLEERQITDVVELAPGIDYRDALKEMFLADGLLLLQAANCNHQVPAKVYEYIRSRRPILALTDAAGDTAATLLNAGIDTIAPLDDSEAIRFKIREFLLLLEESKAPVASEAAVNLYSRSHAAKVLADIFDSL